MRDITPPLLSGSLWQSDAVKIIYVYSQKYTEI